MDVVDQSDQWSVLVDQDGFVASLKNMATLIAESVKARGKGVK